QLLFCLLLQAEGGIRDFHVTGVQTCALPILESSTHPSKARRTAAANARTSLQVLAQQESWTSGCDAPRLPSCDVSRRLLTRWYVMAGRAACGPSSRRPPTGKIRVPTRADTSGEASRRWRTSTSTSSAMASPPLLLAPGLRGRLENGLAEHVPSILHGLRRDGVQCGPQPGTGGHLVGAGFMEVQVEAPVG